MEEAKQLLVLIFPRLTPSVDFTTMTTNYLLSWLGKMHNSPLDAFCSREIGRLVELWRHSRTGPSGLNENFAWTQYDIFWTETDERGFPQLTTAHGWNWFRGKNCKCRCGTVRETMEEVMVILLVTIVMAALDICRGGFYQTNATWDKVLKKSFHSAVSSFRTCECKFK